MRVKYANIMLTRLFHSPSPFNFEELIKYDSR